MTHCSIPNVQLYDDRVGALAAVHMRLAQMGVLMDGHKAELMLEVGGRRAFGRQRLWQCAPGRRGQMRSTSCRPRDRGRARQARPRAHAAQWRCTRFPLANGRPPRRRPGRDGRGQQERLYELGD